MDITPKLQRMEKFNEWIQDPGNTRSHMVLFNISLDLYWTMKILLGKVLIKHGEAYNKLLLQMDSIKEDLAPLTKMRLQLQVIEAKHNILGKPCTILPF